MPANALSSRQDYGLWALLAFGVACLFVALHYSDVTHRSLRWGLPVLLAGLLVRFLSNATIIKARSVCNQGLYSVCRHPMYVGTALAAVGLAVILNRWPFALVIAASIAISWARAAREQHKLESMFPEYAGYRRQVPAIPTPASLLRGIRSGALFSRPSLRRCYENGEITRANVYLMLIAASALYLDHGGRVALGRSVHLVLFTVLLLTTTVSYAWRPPGQALSWPIYAACALVAVAGFAAAAALP
jgi:protein-S-isoprenylcysteine O-methyltransferase Ste14